MYTMPKPGTVIAEYGYNCAGFATDLFVGCEFFRGGYFHTKANDEADGQEQIENWLKEGIWGRVIALPESDGDLIRVIYANKEGSTDIALWGKSVDLWMKIPTE